MTIEFAQWGYALLAGSLTAFAPCVFPLLPLIVGGSLQANRFAPLAMAAGMVSAFAGMGLLFGVFGEQLAIDSEYTRQFGAFLLIVMGLSLWLPRLQARLGQFLSPLADKANNVSNKVDDRSLPGAFIIGALLGLIWSPCSGPLLASTLSLIGTSGGALSGGVLLAIFGFGAALPLLGVAYASRASLSGFRTWIMAHSVKLNRGFGGMTMMLGVMILMGYDKRLEAIITQSLPDFWLQLVTRY